MERCGNNCRAGQATDDNMAHTRCILDTYVHKHTLRICDTFCFSTATLVTRRLLNVTLHVQHVGCLVYKYSRTSINPIALFNRMAFSANSVQEFWCFADRASQYNLSNQPTQCTNSCFIISLLYASTCFEDYVLIFRRSKLYYTASAIITPVGGRPVHGCTRRPPTERDDTRCCIIQFWPPEDEHIVLETCRGI